MCADICRFYQLSLPWRHASQSSPAAGHPDQQESGSSQGERSQPEGGLPARRPLCGGIRAIVRPQKYLCTGDPVPVASSWMRLRAGARRPVWRAITMDHSRVSAQAGRWYKWESRRLDKPNRAAPWSWLWRLQNGGVTLRAQLVVAHGPRPVGARAAAGNDAAGRALWRRCASNNRPQTCARTAALGLAKTLAGRTRARLGPRPPQPPLTLGAHSLLEVRAID